MRFERDLNEVYMRLVDIVILTVLLSLFCPLISSELKVIREMDFQIEEMRMKKDCVKFIPESFCRTCEGGDGFENLNEWADSCRAMWKLESVDWKIEDSLVSGRWSGPYGSGKVYYRKRQSL